MSLREYQREAVVAMVDDLKYQHNSIICLPTAGGKSHIISAFVRYTKIPTLILCPSKEILEQDRDKLLKLVSRDEVGTYSASAGEKTIKLFTFATIGSVYKRHSLFSQFKCVIIDECQNCRADKPNSMYMKLFRKTNPAKVFGISATPFINVSKVGFIGVENGYRCFENKTTIQLMTRTADGFWKDIIYNTTPKEIEKLGFTVPVIYEHYPLLPDSQLRLKRDGSDFDENSFAWRTRGQDRYITDMIARQRTSLVFCSTIEQAQRLSLVVDGSAVVTAKTSKKEREQIITDFKDGVIKHVFNVSCLTVGFDHPSLDTLVMLRPTKSLGLWQQFVGRGVRISPETKKTHCKVIDFSGNHQRLGDASDIHLEKKDGIWDICSNGTNWHGKVMASFIIKR